ncbi:MAG: ABC transporter ATP-binding protein [Sphaerochaetaceae bacterium]
MIEVEDLTFSYTNKPFIEHQNFSVDEGEIFGFLGPSGAGKTTLQKILTGLIPTYRGKASINGMECKKHPKGFYENIGVDFEFSTLYEKLTARENLRFFASLYEKHPCRPETLLEAVNLQNDMDKKVSEYSKGMKSRLNFIKALLHDPAILFLDEPTSGLDPTSSHLMKEMILKEKSQGKTLILTTHNMLDATELCDKVAFIVNGKICAMDSPHNLIMSKGAAAVRYSYYEKGERNKECKLSETAKEEKLQELIKTNGLLSIHSEEPTLNDIFIELTGRTLQ